MRDINQVLMKQQLEMKKVKNRIGGYNGREKRLL